MKTILVVDDDDRLRELVRTTLEDSEYQILEAEDGVEAVRLIKANSPDLVVLDWMMPNLSGVDVVKSLRTRDPAPAFVMLTAKQRPTDIESARAAGVDHYLTKPFSPLELMSKVREILE